MRDEGLRGFYRGVQPRMFNSAIWGTTMVGDVSKYISDDVPLTLRATVLLVLV